ncbi:hypothetical protein Tco_1402186 [Tanacetum coccineum]
MKKKDQIRLDEETALNLQAKFDKEERLNASTRTRRVVYCIKGYIIIALIETWVDIQARLLVDHQLAKRMQHKTEELSLEEEKATLSQKLLEKRRSMLNGKEKRAGTELVQEITKKQKVEDDKETTELKHLMEIIPDEEEVAIDAIPLAVKSPSIVSWKIHKEGRKSYYQITRADGKS